MGNKKRNDNNNSPFIRTEESQYQIQFSTIIKVSVVVSWHKAYGSISDYGDDKHAASYFCKWCVRCDQMNQVKQTVIQVRLNGESYHINITNRWGTQKGMLLEVVSFESSVELWKLQLVMQLCFVYMSFLLRRNGDCVPIVVDSA